MSRNSPCRPNSNCSTTRIGPFQASSSPAPSLSRSRTTGTKSATRFAEADCSSWNPKYTFAIPPSRLIQIDIDPQEIGKIYPVEVGIVGDAKAILALETAIAKDTWEIAKRRERDLTYNLMPIDDLKKLAPTYPWDAALKAQGLDAQKEIDVDELSGIPPLAKLFRATPITTWKTYLIYHYLSAHAPLLPKAFDDENFDFYGHILNGQPKQRDRWKRAVRSTARSAKRSAKFMSPGIFRPTPRPRWTRSSQICARRMKRTSNRSPG